MGVRRHASRERSDRGASLIEFAIILPLLVMMLLGIIEFGWAFAQNLEVKHVAREVGRLATVGDPDNQIDARVCGATVAVIQEASVSGGNSAGDTVTITVVATLQQVTGFFEWALGSTDNLTSEVVVRLEQDLSWNSTEC